MNTFSTGHSDEDTPPSDFPDPPPPPRSKEEEFTSVRYNISDFDVREEELVCIKEFLSSIDWMNKTFELESNTRPTYLSVIRLLKFYKTIIDEVGELLECINDERFAKYINQNDPFLTESDDPNHIEIIVSSYEKANCCKLQPNITALADTLGDLVVYIFSEARRWGIPLPIILSVIMESQKSKLLHGKPLKSPDGAKFIKGPNFLPPEPEIRRILNKLVEVK